MQHPFLTDVVCNAKTFNKINLPYIFESNTEPHFAMQINLKPTHSPIIVSEVTRDKFHTYDQNYLTQFRNYLSTMVYRHKI